MHKQDWQTHILTRSNPDLNLQKHRIRVTIFNLQKSRFYLCLNCVLSQCQIKKLLQGILALIHMLTWSVEWISGATCATLAESDISNWQDRSGPGHQQWPLVVMVSQWAISVLAGLMVAWCDYPECWPLTSASPVFTKNATIYGSITEWEGDFGAQILTTV